MSNKINQTLNELEDEIEEDLDRLYSDIVKDLKRATPKDTGYASKSWKLEQKSNIDKEQQVVISNSAPYIERLNKGHSKQAPKGFVETTMAKTVRNHRQARN